jgi:hypothetical protein
VLGLVDRVDPPRPSARTWPVALHPLGGDAFAGAAIAIPGAQLTQAGTAGRTSTAGGSLQLGIIRGRSRFRPCNNRPRQSALGEGCRRVAASAGRAAQAVQ